MARLELPQVIIIAVLPPPVTGMTLCTNEVAARLEQAGPVRRLNLSNGSKTITWPFRFFKLLRALRSVFYLAVARKRSNAVLYMPIHAHGAVYYNLVAAAVGRLRGYRIVAHHHVHAYIERYDRRIQWLDRLLGRDGLHIVHCDLMRRQFASKYRVRANFFCLQPTIVIHRENPQEKQVKRKHFTLGCLSNLSRQKGLPTVLETFERLQRLRKDTRLILAGPVSGKDVERQIDHCKLRWPDKVEYRGPIYGPDKHSFYRDIDAFLLPTEAESWGTVLSEAMAAACPVITYDRGCIPWVVTDGCGLVVDPKDDYVSRACDQIIEWIDHPASHQASCRSAVDRFRQLQELTEQEVADFVDWMMSPSCTGSAPSASVVQSDHL